MNKYIGFILLIFVFPNFLSSLDDAFSERARGGTVFSVLKGPVSPYFYSVGGGGSAVMVEDNIFLNPAAMYFHNLNSISVGFQKNNVDSSRTDLAYLLRKGQSLYGVSFSFIDYGSFISIDNNGNIIGSFSPYDFIFSTAYGWGKKERFGVRIKYIESNLVYKRMRGVCFDSGFLVKGNKSSLSILAKNIGPAVKLDKNYYHLPFEISVGFGYTYSSSLRGIFELRFPIDNKAHSSLGFEYNLKYADFDFKIRGGLNTLNFRELGIGGVLSGGFGVSIDGFGVEYAFTPYSDIDVAHKMLLKYRFGEIKDKKKEDDHKFKEFVAKEISLRKRIVVFGFRSDDMIYGEMIANSVEEKLIGKKHSVITRQDPLYIANSKPSYKDSSEVINSARKMGADYAVWGKIEKQSEVKFLITMIVFSIRDGKTKEYSFVSNIYNLRNIAIKLVEEISSFIE